MIEPRWRRCPRAWLRKYAIFSAFFLGFFIGALSLATLYQSDFWRRMYALDLAPKCMAPSMINHNGFLREFVVDAVSDSDPKLRKWGVGVIGNLIIRSYRGAGFFWLVLDDDPDVAREAAAMARYTNFEETNGLYVAQLRNAKEAGLLLVHKEMQSLEVLTGRRLGSSPQEWLDSVDEYGWIIPRHIRELKPHDFYRYLFQLKGAETGGPPMNYDEKGGAPAAADARAAQVEEPEAADEVDGAE